MNISPDNFPEPYQSLNEDGCIIDVNDAWLALLGYTREDVMGLLFSDLLSNNEKPLFQAKFKAFKKNGIVDDVDFLLRHKDGHYISCAYKGKIVTDDNGGLVSQCLFYDNTQTIKFKTFYEEIFYYSSKGIIIYAPYNDGEDFIFIEVNPRVEEIEGFTRQQMIGKKVTELFPAVKNMLIFDKFKEAYTTGITQRVPVILYQDDTRIGYRSNTIIKLPSDQLLVIYNDETELEHSRRMLNTTMNTIENMVFTTLEGEDLYWCNNKALEFLGYDSFQAFRNKYKCICELFIEELDNDYIGKEKEGLNWIQYTLNHQTYKDIKVKLAYNSGYNIFKLHVNQLKFDNKERYVVVMENISTLEETVLQLKQKTKKLASSEKRYKDLFKDAPIAYQSLDDEGYILQVNKQWQKLTGCEESVIGQYIGDFISPKTIPSLDKNFPQFKQKGNINDAEWELLNQVTGKATPIRVYGNISYDDNEISHTNCLLYDLTTEKKQDTRLKETFESVMHTFVNILESKDVYTAGHSQRVATYSKEITQKMGCSEEDVDLIFRAGQLHDIGKIITPESILLKPSKFDDDEYVLMKEHAISGYDILNQLKDYGQIASIVKHHHERYDGKGYPDGLSSNEIPELSRIMTICDAFDAMTTNRVYKPRLAIKQAIDEIKKCSGSQFDPKIVPYAISYFESLDEISSTKSIPDDAVSRHRFAYFFKDSLTKAYNGSYLEVFLTNNKIDKLFNEAYLINLHGLHQYNQKNGWKEGDEILKKLVIDLSKATNTDFIFRLYGDKFIVLLESIVPNHKIELPLLNEGLYINQHYQKLIHDKDYSIDVLLDNFSL